MNARTIRRYDTIIKTASTTPSTSSIASVSPLSSNTNVSTTISPTPISASATNVPYIKATWLPQRNSVQRTLKQYTSKSNIHGKDRYTPPTRPSSYPKLQWPSSLPLGHNLDGNEENNDLIEDTSSVHYQTEKDHPEKRNSTTIIPQGTFDLTKITSVATKKKKREHHPNESLVNSLRVPPANPNTMLPEEWFLQMLGTLNLQRFRTVSDGSIVTYGTGYRTFIKFLQLIGSNRTMSIIPTYYHSLGEPEEPFKVFAARSFLTYCIHNLQLKPSVANNYLTGGLHYIGKGLNVDIRAIQTSETVRETRKSLRIEYEQKHAKSGDQDKRIPFTADCIVHSRSTVFNDPSDPVHLAINLTFEIQLITLARVCQLLLHPYDEANHHMLAKEVRFTICKINEAETQPFIIIASDAHKYNQEQYIISQIMFTHGSGKTDQAGSGINYAFDRINKTDGAAFDIVSDAWEWATLAKPRPDDPFMSYRSEWCLTYDQYNNATKKVMKSLGFNEKTLQRVSTHSIRIGGASMLSAAGVPDNIIMKMGNWKSLVFLSYIRLTQGTFNLCFRTLCNSNIIITLDVARLIPNIRDTVPIFSSLSASSSLNPLYMPAYHTGASTGITRSTGHSRQI